MRYVPVETHAHTLHSDGSFTFEALVEQAKTFGYAGLMLTDHNTRSAAEGYRGDFPVLGGEEWTTFYGHLLVAGDAGNTDWRTLLPENIDTVLRQLKVNGAVTGMAHPFATGWPFCTGCRWEFPVTDWDAVGYIEIWNRDEPQEQQASEDAFGLWLAKLKEGYRIAVSAGRDWHRPEKSGRLPAVSYLGMQDIVSAEAIRKAMAKGNLYITLGPTLGYRLQQGERSLYLGDVMEQAPVMLEAQIGKTEIEALLQRPVSHVVFRLLNNETVLKESADHALQWEGVPAPGYLRLEAAGEVSSQICRYLISSPIYVR